MTSEQVLTKQIMLYCGKHNWQCYHINVAKLPITREDGTKYFFNSGVPKGFPDLLVITDKGATFYCETKIKPRKPTKEQIAFINNLIKNGHTAFVAYNLTDFINNSNKFK